MSDKKVLNLGDTLTLEITDINNLGCGVARHDGLVVFVKGGVSGDTVSAKIIKLNKSFAVAKLEGIISASPYREAADTACGERLSCGGCVWRGVSYAHELQMKQNYVSAAFAKAGIADATVLPVLCAGKIYRYRNKIGRAHV